ncbi:DUF3822 domain-containing protein [Gillisia limnaea]|uniref:DUF3822 domain-containing protein n=2 Tax=Gillisia TaxID=244698 RepID=H2BZR6_GILLR|nr:hypothetical protein Gilli_0546 [Gillisia limnaea DSM 15749]
MAVIRDLNMNKLKLSIQVCLNGLSFLILDCEENQLVWHKKTTFQKEFNPAKILKEIELVYEKEEFLQNPIEEVMLLFSNELYSIVPEEYFIEEEASNYLKFNTKILKTDVVAHDLIEVNNLVIVYIPFTNITNYFFDKYGEFEYKHSISVFAQAILSLEKSLLTKVYLNNYTNSYDLVIVRNGKLLLSNSFTYDSAEDFIYYLLFTLEQLKLDPSEIDLILTGEISEESSFYQIVYTYIKNVQFLKPDLNINFTEEYNNQFQREAFILLKSIECE